MVMDYRQRLVEHKSNNRILLYFAVGIIIVFALGLYVLFSQMTPSKVAYREQITVLNSDLASMKSSIYSKEETDQVINIMNNLQEASVSKIDSRVFALESKAGQKLDIDEDDISDSVLSKFLDKVTVEGKQCILVEMTDGSVMLKCQ